MRYHISSSRSIVLSKPVVMIMEDDVLVTSYWGLAGSIEDHCLIYDRISKGRYWSAPESYIVKDYMFIYDPMMDRIDELVYRRAARRLVRLLELERPSRGAFFRSIRESFIREHRWLGMEVVREDRGVRYLAGGDEYTIHGMYASEVLGGKYLVKSNS